MIKSILILAAMIAVPAMAQEPSPASTKLPMCSAKVTDNCTQSAAAEKNALSGQQADKRDARHGGAWAPDAGTATAKKPPQMDKVNNPPA